MKLFWKKHKHFRYCMYFLTLAACALLLFIYGIYIPGIFELQFRPWVNTVLLLLFCIGKYGVIFDVIYLLAMRYQTDSESKIKRKVNDIACIAGCILLTIGVACMFMWDGFFISFSYKKEKIVYYNNMKCVSCESSWPDTWVDYYEYNGSFFMGDKSIPHIPH